MFPVLSYFLLDRPALLHNSQWGECQQNIKIKKYPTQIIKTVFCCCEVRTKKKEQVGKTTGINMLNV